MYCVISYIIIIIYIIVIVQICANFFPLRAREREREREKFIDNQEVTEGR